MKPARNAVHSIGQVVVVIKQEIEVTGHKSSSVVVDHRGCDHKRGIRVVGVDNCAGDIKVHIREHERHERRRRSGQKRHDTRDPVKFEACRGSAGREIEDHARVDDIDVLLEPPRVSFDALKTVGEAASVDRWRSARRIQEHQTRRESDQVVLVDDGTLRRDVEVVRGRDRVLRLCAARDSCERVAIERSLADLVVETGLDQDNITA